MQNNASVHYRVEIDGNDLRYVLLVVVYFLNFLFSHGKITRGLQNFV